MKPKVATAFRLSEEALGLLAALADREGSTKTYMVEMLIRREAEKRRIKA